jgi:hypothetical protein
MQAVPVWAWSIEHFAVDHSLRWHCFQDFDVALLHIVFVLQGIVGSDSSYCYKANYPHTTLPALTAV